MTWIAPTVDDNAWLSCALSLTFLFAAPGLAWGWLWWPVAGAEEDPCRRAATALGLVAAIGLAATLVIALALGGAGLLVRPLHLATVGLLAALGLTAGATRARPRLVSFLRAALPGALVMAILFAVVMLLPKQGEWLLGGWDPGVYLNQGIQVARTGSFASTPLPCFTELSSDGFQLFTTGRADYREMLPAVPVNLHDRSSVVYFFRLFPTFVATVAQSGGLRAATRVNEFAGVLALIALAAALARTRPGMWSVVSVVLLVAQPLWLYHLHTPTSEMLHLALVLVGVFFWSLRARGFRWNAAFGVALLLGVVNRFDHMVFASLWVAVTALCDLMRPDRRRVLGERVVQVAGIVAGAAADAVFSRLTLLRLEHLLPLLVLATAALLLAAATIDALAAAPRVRALAARGARPSVLLLALLAAAGVLALWFAPLPRFFHEPVEALRHALPYLGFVSVAAALCGGVWLAWMRCEECDAPLGGCVLFLAGCAMALLVESHITPIYPWAARRHLPFTIPAVVLLSGLTIAHLLAWPGRLRPLARAAAGLLLAAILWTQKDQARDAWRSTEYDGVSRELAALAAQIGPDDVVLADHPWWGTPLLFVHGKQVLNGEVLWDQPEPAQVELGLQTLGELAAHGHRIRLLTSTGGGLEVYPFRFEGATLDWRSPVFTYREIQHHRSARGFATRERQREFQLYTWRPAPAPASTRE